MPRDLQTTAKTTQWILCGLIAFNDYNCITINLIIIIRFITISQFAHTYGQNQHTEMEGDQIITETSLNRIWLTAYEKNVVNHSQTPPILARATSDRVGNFGHLRLRREEEIQKCVLDHVWPCDRVSASPRAKREFITTCEA